MTYETAMGMRGYRGSAAEQEDREQGIKVGGFCCWVVEDQPVARITQIEIDEDGDPWFHLTFIDRRQLDCGGPWTDHKDVRVERNEVRPYKGYLQWGARE